MKFQKYSKYLIIASALLWVILLAVPMPLAYRYLYLGILIFYLGIQNMILLNIGQKTGEIPAKMAAYHERLGIQKGTVYYAIFSVLIYVLIGAVVVYYGYTMLVHPVS